MDQFKEFLESSTVHGLVYISTTKQFSRLFWVAVVVCGFSVAGMMIQQSVSDWRESPVSTSTETLDIANITFPPIIVCPPKGTFTNLNYDLDRAEKITLNQEAKDSLTTSTKMIIEDVSNTDLNDLEKSFTVTDKLLNRYKGISLLNLPFAEADADEEVLRFNYRLITGATEGTFTTPHFQQTFELKNFMRKVDFNLDIEKPDSAADSKIMLEIELDTKETSGGDSYLRLNMEFLQKTGPKVIKRVVEDAVTLNYFHSLSEADLENWSNKRMLGMKVKWFYTKNDQPTEVTPAEKYKNTGANVQFRKLANILQSQIPVESLWQKVKAVRVNWLTENKYEFDRETLCKIDGWMTPVNMINATVQETLIAAVIESLEISTDTTTVNANINESHLATAADIHYHLTNCPHAEWIEKLNFLTSLISSAPTRSLLATLNKMITMAEKIGQPVQASAFREVLGKITEVANLDHSKIELMIQNGSVQKSVDNADVRRLSNHPVHIVDAGGEFSPSSFIPFCEFGGDQEVMGLKSARFDVPVCNKFHQIIFYDQLCYQVDVGSFSDEVPDSKMKRLAGLTFWLDYNEEKQTGAEKQEEQPASTGEALSSNYLTAEDESKALIYIGTLAPLRLYGRHHFALSAVKEVAVTPSFLSLPETTRKCQLNETLHGCQTRKYLELLSLTCHCLPFHLKTESQAGVATCDEAGLSCARTVALPSCLPPCQGIFSDVSQTSLGKPQNFEWTRLNQTMTQYERYKDNFQPQPAFPLNTLKDFEHKTELHFVRIYFDTPTFDRITKDSKMKMSDMVGTVGGTMGLLTGFSIISAVEILYFAAKILSKIYRSFMK